MAEASSSVPDNNDDGTPLEESWNDWIKEDIKALSKQREEIEFEKSPAGQAMKRLNKKNKASTRTQRPQTAGAATSKHRQKPRVPFENFEGCLRRSNFRAFYNDPSEETPFTARPKTTGQLRRRLNSRGNTNNNSGAASRNSRAATGSHN